MVWGVSAPNYFTFLGDIEECQGSTAEDEAEDIGYDKDKQKIVKGGYCSGATVPKVDLSFGRKRLVNILSQMVCNGGITRIQTNQGNIGRVAHNIKDVIRCAGDLQYKALYDTTSC